MKKINFFILIYNIIFILILIPSMGSVFAQDIAELASEKFLLQVDDQYFQIFYGFKGSLEVEIGEKIIDSKGDLNDHKSRKKITSDKI
jgi:hypothetical protein